MPDGAGGVEVDQRPVGAREVDDRRWVVEDAGLVVDHLCTHQRLVAVEELLEVVETQVASGVDVDLLDRPMPPGRFEHR